MKHAALRLAGSTSRPKATEGAQEDNLDSYSVRLNHVSGMDLGDLRPTLWSRRSHRHSDLKQGPSWTVKNTLEDNRLEDHEELLPITRGRRSRPLTRECYRLTAAHGSTRASCHVSNAMPWVGRTSPLPDTPAT
ncbi:Protein of unknown function [Gryllus bimaculatus]|nr:Protein of unknown function [Gryllus bimaculatus]